VWYTDGSRTKEDTGTGIHGVRPKIDIEVSLGRHATIFQAEVYAIIYCLLQNINSLIVTRGSS
jgi:hypothetical protein